MLLSLPLTNNCSSYLTLTLFMCIRRPHSLPSLHNPMDDDVSLKHSLDLNAVFLFRIFLLFHFALTSVCFSYLVWLGPFFVVGLCVLDVLDRHHSLTKEKMVRSFGVVSSQQQQHRRSIPMVTMSSILLLFVAIVFLLSSIPMHQYGVNAQLALPIKLMLSAKCYIRQETPFGGDCNMAPVYICSSFFFPDLTSTFILIVTFIIIIHV
jgi:hypothetical protein